MSPVPTLHYKLSHRTPGSFGTSTLGRVAEWATASWYRFEYCTILLILVPCTVLLGNGNGLQHLATVLMSPLMALLLLWMLKITGWLSYMMPILPLGRAIAWSRIGFLFAFHRLIAEPTPGIEMPLWIGR